MFRKISMVVFTVLLLTACVAISAFFDYLRPFEYDIAVNEHFAATPFRHGQKVVTVSSNSYTVTYQHNRYSSVRLHRIGYEAPGGG